MGGCDDTHRTQRARRPGPGSSCRGDDPFRWCLGGPPVSEDGDSEAFDDNLVDDELGPGERIKFKIWHDGATYTIETPKPTSEDEGEQARLMIEAAVYAVNRERGEVK